MRSFFHQRVLTSAKMNFLKIAKREMDIMFLFLVPVCFSNTIVDLYETLFENYNTVKMIYLLMGKINHQFRIFLHWTQMTSFHQSTFQSMWTGYQKSKLPNLRQALIKVYEGDINERSWISLNKVVSGRLDRNKLVW